ncbi:MAG: hypothetical protein ACI9MC_001468 [Kiritimatiellia bacterium]|jgi:hypothetical protein
MPRCLLLLALLTSGCNGDSETDPSYDGDCGDPDGSGGDTGDVPSLLGSWTSNYGLSFLDGNCPSDQIPSASLDFMEQPFEVEGSVPSAVVMTFAKDPDLRLTGTVSPGGAWAMSGTIERGQTTLYVALGGLLYSDQSGRTHWDGAVFVGGDLNGDNIIDCDFRGDWRARKSGT